MKFGVRECCDVVLRAKSAQKIGHKIFYKNEPVCYFDTLKTSTFEGAATTVYAQGGRGNARLMSWDGERTVTFTMEDALISPIGLSILTGAGLIEASKANKITQHIAEQTSSITSYQTGESGSEVDTIFAFVDQKPKATEDPSIYVMILDDHGEVQSEPYLFTVFDDTLAANVDSAKWDSTKNGYVLDSNTNINAASYLGVELAGTNNDDTYKLVIYGPGMTDPTKKPGTVVSGDYAGKYPIIFKENTYKYGTAKVEQTYYIADKTVDGVDYFGADHIDTEDNTIVNYGKTNLTLLGTAQKSDTKAILVDYYTEHTSGAFEINITPDKFGGTFYLEASTLWRDQATGQDLPAEFIIPNCKVQSNFSFTLASSGDPSSFTFTMDAFPDYTRWNPTEKVFATIQVIGASTSGVNEVYREQTWTSSAYEPIGGIIQGAIGDSN